VRIDRRYAAAALVIGGVIYVASLDPGGRMYASQGLVREVPGVGMLTHEICFERRVEARTIGWGGFLGELATVMAPGFNHLSRWVAEARGRSECPDGASIESLQGELANAVGRTGGLRFAAGKGGARPLVEVPVSGESRDALAGSVCRVLAFEGFAGVLDLYLAEGGGGPARRHTCP
jgi:hypothetical protein